MRKTLDALKSSVSAKEDSIQTQNTAKAEHVAQTSAEVDIAEAERKFNQLRMNSTQLMGDIKHLRHDSAKIEINIDSLRSKTQRLQSKYPFANHTSLIHLKTSSM